MHEDPPRVGDTVWRVPAIQDVRLWHGVPAADENRAYFDVENSIRAYDIRSGREVWRTVIRTGMHPDARNLVVSAGMVLVSHETGIIALDTLTGALRWKATPDDSIIQSFGAADGSMYYTSTRGPKVYALSLPGGGVAWSKDLSDPSWLKSNVIGLAVSGDTVFAAGVIRRTEAIVPRDIFIIALDRNDGREIWRYETQTAGDNVLYAAPLITPELVIMPDERERSVFALDRRTGVRLWSIMTDSSWGGPGPIPWVSDGVMYFGSSDRYVYAVGLATGTLLWKTKAVVSVTHVAVCGKYVFANNQGLTILERHSGRFVREVVATIRDFPTSHLLAFDDRVLFSGTVAIYALAC